MTSKLVGRTKLVNCVVVIVIVPTEVLCAFAEVILTEAITQLSLRLFLPLCYWKMTLVSPNDVKLKKVTNL